MGSVLCFHLSDRNGSGRAAIEEGEAGGAGDPWKSLAETQYGKVAPWSNISFEMLPGIYF